MLAIITETLLKLTHMLVRVFGRNVFMLKILNVDIKIEVYNLVRYMNEYKQKYIYIKIHLNTEYILFEFGNIQSMKNHKNCTSFLSIPHTEVKKEV